MAQIELCCECDEPTGRAGKSDDSLYCEFCEGGPFCEECHGPHVNKCGEQTAQVFCDIVEKMYDKPVDAPSNPGKETT